MYLTPNRNYILKFLDGIISDVWRRLLDLKIVVITVYFK